MAEKFVGRTTGGFAKPFEGEKRGKIEITLVAYYPLLSDGWGIWVDPNAPEGVAKALIKQIVERIRVPANTVKLVAKFTRENTNPAKPFRYETYKEIDLTKLIPAITIKEEAVKAE